MVLVHFLIILQKYHHLFYLQLFLIFYAFYLTLLVYHYFTLPFTILSKCKTLRNYCSPNNLIKRSTNKLYYYYYYSYYFLYDDWSMYVVYDFSSLVSVKRISVGKLFCKIDYDTSRGVKIGWLVVFWWNVAGIWNVRLRRCSLLSVVINGLSTLIV